jgi:propionaldehyde dehydrogenase
MKTESDLEALIRGVVSQVVGDGSGGPPARAESAGTQASATAADVAPPRTPTSGSGSEPGSGVMFATALGRSGLFASMDDAVSAAATAQKALAGKSIEDRKRFIEAIRKVGVDNAEALARSAHEETGLGRFRDKVDKNVFAATRTLGVEDLEPRAFAGDHGLAVEDYLPWGVVASVTPVNSPSAFMINHGITMLAGGNSVVFNTHPGCRNTSMTTVRLMNEAVVSAGGPDNLMTGVVEPTLETAKALVTHPGIDMLVITGGAALIKDAFATRKRVIAAGPGNPTAVVDETSDVKRAAREIFKGASFENTILCIGEKTCIVADKAAPGFLAEMDRLPVRRLSADEVERVFASVIDSSGHHPVTRREFVGKDAELILRAAGLSANKPVGLLLAEVEQDHPLVWMEQFLPFLPVVRVRDVCSAIDLGIEVEGHNRHTVMIHSNDPSAIERFSREANTVVCVVNGSSLRGLGVEGEGYPGFTIGTVTGEGITSARHYVKAHRISHTR